MNQTKMQPNHLHGSRLQLNTPRREAEMTPSATYRWLHDLSPHRRHESIPHPFNPHLTQLPHSTEAPGRGCARSAPGERIAGRCSAVPGRDLERGHGDGNTTRYNTTAPPS